MKNKKKAKKSKLDNFAETKRRNKIEETMFWLSVLALFTFAIIGGAFWRCSNIHVAIVFFSLTAISIMVMIVCLFANCDCGEN